MKEFKIDIDELKNKYNSKVLDIENNIEIISSGLGTDMFIRDGKIYGVRGPEYHIDIEELSEEFAYNAFINPLYVQRVKINLMSKLLDYIESLGEQNIMAIWGHNLSIRHAHKGGTIHESVITSIDFLGNIKTT